MDTQTNFDPQIFEVYNVHGYADSVGTVHLLVDDVAVGLGIVQVKKNRVPTCGDKSPKSGDTVPTSGYKPYTAIRWERINKYLRDCDCLGKDDPDVKSGNYIPEQWFYFLAMKANNAAAKKFQYKVAYEIMPAIRKNGTYSLTGETAPAAVAKPAKVKNPNRVAGQKTPAGIYAAKVGDKVKIGHSHDAKKRLPHVKGRTEKTYYQTALFPRKVARLLEWACHTIFAPFALGNEFFDIEYDEACRIIKTLEKLIVGLSKVYNVERDDKSLVVATKNFVEYVNLIADKKN